MDALTGPDTYRSALGVYPVRPLYDGSQGLLNRVSHWYQHVYSMRKILILSPETVRH